MTTYFNNLPGNLQPKLSMTRLCHHHKEHVTTKLHETVSKIFMVDFRKLGLLIFAHCHFGKCTMLTLTCRGGNSSKSHTGWGAGYFLVVVVRNFLMIYSTENHQRGGWVGLEKSKTWWRNTWMVPNRHFMKHDQFSDWEWKLSNGENCPKINFLFSNVLARINLKKKIAPYKEKQG